MTNPFFLTNHFPLNVAEFLSAFRENPNNLTSEYPKIFNEPKFRSRETGISRRDISVWRKEGLLPYEPDEITWRTFSLIECIWLRLISKLKKFGIENEIIKAFKERAFNQRAEDYKRDCRLAYDNAIIADPKKDLLGEILKKIEKFKDEELHKILVEHNYSLFGNLIMPTCLFKLNMALIFTEDGSFGVVNIGKPLNEEQEVNIAQVFRELNNCSFLLINLLELCSNFFENEKLIIDSNYYLGIMNENERTLIKEIRTGKYKQLTVKVKDGSITHIKQTREDRENEDMIRKLSRLMKKGDYKEIELLTRDGKIVKYSEINILKMNE